MDPKEDKTTLSRLVGIQASSLCALSLWYPIWRTSTMMEVMACEKARPTILGAIRNLNKLPWRVYSGLSTTAALQFVYPGFDYVKGVVQRQTGASPLTSELVTGLGIAPISSIWKTVVLGKTATTTGWQHLRAHPTSYLRGVVPFWAVRQAILAPCIFNGPKYTRSLLFGEEGEAQGQGESASVFTSIISLMIPALVGTLVSHPADLMTSLLNSDPLKKTYPTNWSAVQSVYQSRGLRGMMVGFGPRVVALSTEIAAFAYFREQFVSPSS